jgi:2,3-bisphosphoglycerate-independent phosphoglycerate mutase
MEKSSNKKTNYKKFAMKKKPNPKQSHPVALIILDGWGHRTDKKHNAVAAAHKPYFDMLWKKYPHTLLDASGLAVGLPKGQMGNSEIGHTTIGAGKVIDTDLVRIAKSIEMGEFENNPAFKKLFTHVKKNKSTLHVQGLLSDGGVHSHSDHLFAFLKAAKKAGIGKVAIHIFTDGRDTAPQSAAKYIAELEKVIAKVGVGIIASISGRFYAMDRDNNWDRLAKTEEVMFGGKGNTITIKPSAHIAELYKAGKLDEHLEPIICEDGCVIAKNDGIFFFNFRADRARMISKKIIERRTKMNLCYVTMTDYGSEYDTHIAFPTIAIETTLAKEISKAGKSQAHIAETEKFPHATYFLNGGVEKPHKKESHEMLASRKDVKTHDEAPKMRAEGIADKALEHIERGTDFIFINFANPDMVGHTANVPAIIEAVEEVDKQLRRVSEALLAKGGTLFITADHGNAEVNVDPKTGEKHTAHTTNLVPAIVASAVPKYLKAKLNAGGGLSDIAPTILEMMGVKKHKTMTGKILIKK